MSSSWPRSSWAKAALAYNMRSSCTLPSFAGSCFPRTAASPGWATDHTADDDLADGKADPRLNILIIEPDDARRSAMMARIANRGDRVTACRRVGDATTVLTSLASAGQAPHAIVSDVHLGDGDGLSFYLAASRRFPDIRWIVTAPPQPLPAIA